MMFDFYMLMWQEQVTFKGRYSFVCNSTTLHRNVETFDLYIRVEILVKWQNQHFLFAIETVFVDLNALFCWDTIYEMWKVNFSYAKPQILIAFYYPEMLTTKIYLPVKK